MTIAAIDIGSNSIRILVADENGRQLVRRAEVTGLGQGVDRTGVMGDDAIARTMEVMEGFGSVIDALGATRVGAVATSAFRDAGNGQDVIRRISEVIGVVPEIISGRREAQLSFAGATADIPRGGSRVVIDIGGGSTEIVEGSDGRVTWARSYDIGSVRLTDRVVTDRPAPVTQVEAGLSEVRRVLDAPPVEPRSLGPIGVAGTFTSLAAIHLRLASYDPEVVHGTILATEDIEELVATLASMTIDQTAAIPSLDPRRAPVILAGGVVAQAVLAAVGADHVMVSERDLLDGLAAELVTG